MACLMKPPITVPELRRYCWYPLSSIYIDCFRVFRFKFIFVKIYNQMTSTMLKQAYFRQSSDCFRYKKIITKF